MRGSKMVGKGGPGSRGGKVVGQTKTGRPVYASSKKLAAARTARKMLVAHEKTRAAEKQHHVDEHEFRNAMDHMMKLNHVREVHAHRMDVMSRWSSATPEQRYALHAQSKRLVNKHLRARGHEAPFAD